MEHDPILEFLKKHHRQWTDWTHVPEYLQWFYKHDCYAVVTNGKEITGVGLARPVEKPEDGLTNYHFDPLGSCLFVDLVICTSKEAEKLLFQTIFKKAGKPATIAFQKCSRRLHVHLFDRFMKRYLRKEIFRR